MKNIKLARIAMYLFAVVFLILPIAIYIGLNNKNKKLQNQYNELETKYNIAVENINTFLNDKTKDIALEEANKRVEDIEATNKAIAEYSKQCKEELEILLSNYNDLVKENEYMSENLDIFVQRQQLYDKHEYAINYAGKRTDIDYEYITFLEDLIKDDPLNDVDLYLAIIMAESTGNQYAVSSSGSGASGFAQFTPGTSEWVYNDMCNFDKPWNKDVVFDAKTCLIMMRAYVNYLVCRNKGNVEKAIVNYRGAWYDSYMNRLNNFLAKAGKSIDAINEITLQRYKEINN